MLPYASLPKRPRGSEGKIREGVWQTNRHYRPLVVTDRRLLVMNAGRNHVPHGLLAAYPLNELRITETRKGRFGVDITVVDLPGEGPVPFETGKKDDRAKLVELLSA
jgi:hypothetical protein